MRSCGRLRRSHLTALAAFVVGMARNPTMTVDSRTTLVGMGFLLGLVIVLTLMAGLLLYLE